MSSGKPIIDVQQLGKCYKLGHQAQRAESFRDVLAGILKAPLRNLRRISEDGMEHEMFWALKDVSFQAERGEVVGIVGSNGAGKSTLLKILSRITEPTTGRALLRGRLASLLEVGTGFHPELTGRENIFLNGSILGMKRTEIQRKFDEIVAFSEVEAFLDTPVKYYSSGMYVRLAFAVAAHLEPDVLVVDEVLAVGDAEFQRKCLGKMQQVAAGEGRTVLFVSHNMSAVQKLCTRAILLRKGQVVTDGPAEDVVRQYLTNLADSAETSLTGDNPDRTGNGKMRLTRARLVTEDGVPTRRLVAGEPITLELGYRNPGGASRGNIYMLVLNHLGTAVTTLDTGVCNFTLKDFAGEGTITCRIPRVPFPMGRYHISVTLDADGQKADSLPNLIAFEVETSRFYDSQRTPSVNLCAVMVEHTWTHTTDTPTGLATSVASASAVE
ncbi:MAG: ABC transporter ATP-binding protein [Tepidisphaeraceae bacterium]|jgi:lipopolysaccharide transport system ATP-binding protein